ncbi:hypothetical protein KKE25_04240 [Patescibacteria group bacterium]|nr:hypothetical protein [Patescibacteria group bacterium]
MDTTQINDQFTLESVQQQFTDWRASRHSKREHIPDRLWQAAVQLCNVHSVNHVSRSLQLSYTALGKRLACNQIAKEKSVQFLRLEMDSPYSGQWQMECFRADGGRLHVSATGALPSLGELLQGFWS